LPLRIAPTRRPGARYPRAARALSVTGAEAVAGALLVAVDAVANAVEQMARSVHLLVLLRP